MPASVHSSGSYSKPGAQQNFSFGMTIPAGSGKALVVGVAGNSGPLPFVTSVKLGTTDMTAALGADQISGVTQSRFWYMLAPPAGDATVNVVDGWVHDQGAWFWAVLDGVDTGSAPAELETAAYGDSISLTVATPANGISIGLSDVQSGIVSVAGGSTGLVMNLQDGRSGPTGNLYYTTGATLGASWTASPVDATLVALVFSAASGGTSATASGATVTGTASLVAGSASASTSATATGKTLTAASSLLYPGGTLAFQAAGMEFGARTGLGISTFALEAGVSYRYSVHADGLTLGAALYTSAAITLDGAGKLPNLAALSWITPGTLYRVHAIRQSDGEAATYRMRALA
mgnify:CR=1 FL=1